MRKWIAPLRILQLSLLLLSLVLAPGARAASTPPASGTGPVPSLPGISRDVFAAAARFDSGGKPAPQCPWCTGQRIRRWAPALALAAATAGVAFGAEPPRHARWDTRNSFDDWFQDGLGGDSRSTRDGAATASTALLAVLSAGFLTDVYLLRDEYAVEQSLAVGVGATMATILVTESAKVAAGRERPYVRRCRTNPGYSDSCGSGRDDNGGFLSTHASTGATLAGLVCTRRLHRRAVSWTDRVLCGGAVATAAATGILRITAEKHYVTDVLAAWASGAFFGGVLPSLLPEWSGIGDDESPQGLSPLAGADGIGVEYTARF